MFSALALAFGLFIRQGDYKQRWGRLEAVIFLPLSHYISQQRCKTGTKKTKTKIKTRDKNEIKIDSILLLTKYLMQSLAQC